MKQLLLFLIASINLGLTAQNEEYVGTYINLWEFENGDVMKYELQINSDQTFTFHFYRNIICSVCKEENKYGKGIWKVENKIVYFTTNTSDLDAINILNFSGTSARLIMKSPRDSSDKVIPTALQFYKSNIFWIENLKILKKE